MNKVCSQAISNYVISSQKGVKEIKHPKAITVLKCLLCGLFTNCAWQRGAGAGWGGGGAAGGGGARAAGRYVTAAGAAAALHPASALQALRPPPAALLYTELLVTGRTYMLTASAIQPHWLHQVAPDYARRCRANR
ncbi:unnamed protein product [Spodoptera exigua]|nr:unnamed protein product [Spodoptera exigua]